MKTTTSDRRLGRSKEARAKTLLDLEARLTQPRYALLAARWTEASTRLATETLRRLLFTPSLSLNTDAYIDNAAHPCEVPDCPAVRYLDGSLCVRHYVMLSERGDLDRRPASWLACAEAREVVRRFLANPLNGGNPAVKAGASALRGWVAGPPLPIQGKPAGRRGYLRVRSAISAAQPKPSDVLAAVVGMLLEEARRNARHEPLIDTMRQDWTFAGATLVGRTLARLCWVGSRTDIPYARGGATRLLAKSLPEVARLTMLRLVAAIEADRLVTAAATSTGAMEFVSPTTGLLITVYNQASAKEAGTI
jgi:hypothetical protein